MTTPAPAPKAPANTELPAGLEIFAAGTRPDDQGRMWTFTPEQVREIAEGYQPTLREAPITIGHQAKDRPAWGWARRLVASAAGKLLMDSRDVHPAFAEAHRTRRFPKVSSAFYGPDHPNNPTPGRWYLRHVAFLGAEQPAVAGLLDPTLQALQAQQPTTAFADSGEGLICFSETQEPDPVDKELQAQRDAEKARADAATAEAAAANARLAQFAEQAAAQRHSDHVAFAEAAFKAGKLKTPEVPLTVAALDFIGGLENGTVQFSEGATQKTASVLAFVKDCISARGPAANFSEQLPGGTGAGAGGEGAGKRPDDAELDRLAREYATKQNVQYAEALHKVSASFTS